MARTDLKLIGAAEERRAVLRKVRRMMKLQAGLAYVAALNDLETWLLDRDKRYNKRKGGLGK